MFRSPPPFLLFALLSFAACGGSSKDKDKDPPIPPNEPPVLAVPQGLAGASPSYSLTLPIADSRTLLFTATDAEAALLLWQVAVSSGGATAAGLTFTSPTRGSAFQMELAPIATPIAVQLSLLVEDPRGAAAAIDLLIVRSGPPTITKVTPSSAFTTRVQRVQVTGTALQLGGATNTTLAFDGLAATNLVVADDTTLLANTPTTAAVGPTIVGVSTLFGTASLPASAFQMHAFPPVLQPTDTRLDAGAASALEFARDGSTLHSVWLEGANVVHRVSTDRGATWSTPQTLSINIASEPQVLAEGNEVSVAWIGDDTAVWLRRSTDGGVTFQGPQQLTPIGATTPVRRPRLAQSGLRRYAAWLLGTEVAGTSRLVAATSTDGGVAWSNAITVADGGANQRNHELASDGAIAWLLWEDERAPGPRGAFVARTIDAGATWLPALRLDAPGTTATSPRLAASSGRVFAAWVQNGPPPQIDGLVMRSSSDQGANWNSTIFEVQNDQSGAVTEPKICSSATEAVLAYVVGGATVRVARIPVTGGSSPPAILNPTASLSAAPSLSCSGNYVFVAWREGDVGSGAARIRFSVATDSGVTFQPAAGFGNGPAAQDNPRLAVDGAELFVGWIDARDATSAVYANLTAN